MAKNKLWIGSNYLQRDYFGSKKVPVWKFIDWDVRWNEKQEERYQNKYSIQKAFIFDYPHRNNRMKGTVPTPQSANTCCEMQILLLNTLETIEVNQIVMKCTFSATHRLNIESIMNFVYIVFNSLAFFSSSQSLLSFMIKIDQVLYSIYHWNKLETQMKTEKNDKRHGNI